MLSQLFLGMSLVGSEWVLYLLLALSVVSISVIFERCRFYREANRGLSEFRRQIRGAALQGRWKDVESMARARLDSREGLSPDLEAEMVEQLIQHHETQLATQTGGQTASRRNSPEILSELARDTVARSRLRWDRNLSILATIGSNAPFVGLFGTVLGIIKAFHDLSLQAGGPQNVTSGISEALVATAFGLLVAIPAVVAFNLFQRKVKSALTEAEALKSFLVGKLAD